MEVTASRAWKAAEWDYGALQADLQMASLWGALSHEQIVSRLRNIARRCPHFYPAILELGLRLLCQKRHRGAERMIERGFGLMIELTDPERSARTRLKALVEKALIVELGSSPTDPKRVYLPVERTGRPGEVE